MVIALIICIPVTTLIGGFLVLKAVQLGLRWNIQSENKEQPTLNNPVVDAVAQSVVVKRNKKATNVMSEWFFGKETEDS